MTPEINPDTTAGREYVSLVASGQSYCIEITTVREIRRWSSVTAIPNTHDAVLGVMNLRGAVIPIIDLSAKLGFPPAEICPRSVVVVTAIEDRTIGVLVDAVSEIILVNSDAVEPNPNIGGDERVSGISGLVSINGEMLKILAPESFVDFAPETLQ